MAMREGLEKSAEFMLAAISLMPVDSAALDRASRIAPTGVRSLDAIHLDAIVQLHGHGDIDRVLTYDHQLQEGCVYHGISVVAPTAR